MALFGCQPEGEERLDSRRLFHNECGWLAPNLIVGKKSVGVVGEGALPNGLGVATKPAATADCRVRELCWASAMGTPSRRLA